MVKRTKFPDHRSIPPKLIEDDLMSLIRITNDCPFPSTDEIPLVSFEYDVVRPLALRYKMFAMGAKLELAHVVRQWREQHNKREKVGVRR